MTIEPLDYDSLTEPQQKTFREIAALRERNVDRINKIEANGFSVDIWTARLEHFMMSMLWAGIITIDQLLAIQKDWELSLRQQSRTMLARVEETVAAERQAGVRAPQKKLWTPGG